jgi:alkanesulfonate monooxygenase SsuD/methylene tetrahydromethanopterin reductase-like flavin-dependent oxidoreductase (luciferase family)
MKVGVLLPPGDVRGTGTVFSYPELRGLALTAEESGLDSIWIYDHLVFQFGDKPKAGVWECWTILSGLAEATKRVELGTLVVCTAFRNPAVLAKMAVTLDAMSGQRLILGIGAGWHEPGFTTFGLPFDHLADRFEEAVKIIAPLVREGRVDFHGKYVSAPDCDLLPGPERKIPLLIASGGPRMLRLTAQYADSWNTAWLGDASALAEPRAALAAASAAVGRDPATLEVTVGISVAYPDLGRVPKDAGDPQKFLDGSSVEALAAGLRGYADAGVGHVIAWQYPVTEEGTRRLAEAAKLAKG